MWWRTPVGFAEGGRGRRITSSRPAWATHFFLCSPPLHNSPARPTSHKFHTHSPLQTHLTRNNNNNNNNAYTHTYTIQNVLSASPSVHLQCYTLPAITHSLTHSLTRINSQRKSRESNNLNRTGRVASLTEETGTGEMAQRLRALPALPKVLSSIPSNHMVAHNHL